MECLVFYGISAISSPDIASCMNIQWLSNIYTNVCVINLQVKKNLEHLYKKLEKHLCEEENLLQVVWLHMQDEFIKQYKHFEGLIAKCYPDAGITFEFTINDLLGYFSEIAQSH